MHRWLAFASASTVVVAIPLPPLPPAPSSLHGSNNAPPLSGGSRGSSRRASVAADGGNAIRTKHGVRLEDVEQDVFDQWVRICPRSYTLVAKFGEDADGDPVPEEDCEKVKEDEDLTQLDTGHGPIEEGGTVYLSRILEQQQRLDIRVIYDIIENLLYQLHCMHRHGVHQGRQLRAAILLNDNCLRDFSDYIRNKKQFGTVPACLVPSPETNMLEASDLPDEKHAAMPACLDDVAQLGQLLAELLVPHSAATGSDHYSCLKQLVKLIETQRPTAKQCLDAAYQLPTTFLFAHPRMKSLLPKGFVPRPRPNLSAQQPASSRSPTTGSKKAPLPQCSTAEKTEAPIPPSALEKFPTKEELLIKEGTDPDDLLERFSGIFHWAKRTGPPTEELKVQSGPPFEGKVTEAGLRTWAQVCPRSYRPLVKFYVTFEGTGSTQVYRAGPELVPLTRVVSKLDASLIASIMENLLYQLQCMHSHGVVHGGALIDFIMLDICCLKGTRRNEKAPPLPAHLFPAPSTRWDEAAPVASEALAMQPKCIAEVQELGKVLAIMMRNYAMDNTNEAQRMKDLLEYIETQQPSARQCRIFAYGLGQHYPILRQPYRAVAAKMSKLAYANWQRICPTSYHPVVLFYKHSDVEDMRLLHAGPEVVSLLNASAPQDVELITDVMEYLLYQLYCMHIYGVTQGGDFRKRIMLDKCSWEKKIRKGHALQIPAHLLPSAETNLDDARREAEPSLAEQPSCRADVSKLAEILAAWLQPHQKSQGDEHNRMRDLLQFMQSAHTPTAEQCLRYAYGIDHFNWFQRRTYLDVVQRRNRPESVLSLSASRESLNDGVSFSSRQTGAMGSAVDIRMPSRGSSQASATSVSAQSESAASQTSEGSRRPSSHRGSRGPSETSSRQLGGDGTRRSINGGSSWQQSSTGQSSSSPPPPLPATNAWLKDEDGSWITSKTLIKKTTNPGAAPDALSDMKDAYRTTGTLHVIPPHHLIDAPHDVSSAELKLDKGALSTWQRICPRSYELVAKRYKLMDAGDHCILHAGPEMIPLTGLPHGLDIIVISDLIENLLYQLMCMHQYGVMQGGALRESIMLDKTAFGRTEPNEEAIPLIAHILPAPDTTLHKAMDRVDPRFGEKVLCVSDVQHVGEVLGLLLKGHVEGPPDELSRMNDLMSYIQTERPTALQCLKFAYGATPQTWSKRVKYSTVQSTRENSRN